MKSADGRFEYLDKDGDPLPNGSTLEQVGRFAYNCRGGASGKQGGQCSINIANAGYNLQNRNWKLTGSVDAPTITPSINCADCWHGFIKDGKYLNTANKPEAKQ